MTQEQRFRRLYDVCNALGADVRYSPEHGHLTVLAWESEGKQRALFIQRQIQLATANYPELVCYCFDPFSTLVYAIKNTGLIPQRITA